MITKTAPKIPSADEKQELWQRAVQGDIPARDALIAGHERMIWQIARRYAAACRHLTAEDLYQEGVMGIMLAIEKYDPALSQFSTYAILWIKQHIIRAVDQQEDMIRIPIHVRDKSGAPPSCASLDKPIDEDESTLYDLMPTPERDTPQDGIAWAAIFQHAKLTPREIYIICARYGGDGRSLESVGKMMQITRERVRQLEKKALIKIRATVGTLEDERIRAGFIGMSGLPPLPIAPPDAPPAHRLASPSLERNKKEASA